MLVLVLVLALAGSRAWAQAAERFKGLPLEPVSGSYLATKDMPILETPGAGVGLGGTKSKAAAKGKEKDAPPAPAAKKVGELKKGEEVTVFGRSGAWLAVQKGEEKLGFVAVDSLAPILDGTLARDVAGTVAAGGHNCRYTIRFEGRTAVDMGPGRFADYSASFACDRGATRLAFEAPMFMSEIPHQGGPKAIYQIALDVPSISPNPDQAFSTILFYDRDKGEVALETAWPAEWLVKAKPAPRRAGDVATALVLATELTLSSWGPKPWEALAKRER
ncbi:MAG: hypothetical protein EXR02_06255 [Rhodospirillales bacterium]|nr:hypothetical protein [Rhodospirillales bacterium]